MGQRRKKTSQLRFCGNFGMHVGPNIGERSYKNLLYKISLSELAHQFDLFYFYFLVFIIIIIIIFWEGAAGEKGEERWEVK